MRAPRAPARERGRTATAAVRREAGDREEGAVTRSLVWFAGLAYALSWAIEVPLALAHQGLTGEILPFWTHYLSAYGPALAAVAVTAATGGSAAVRRLGGRLLHWKVGGAWWLAAVAPLIVGVLVALLVTRWGGGGSGLAGLGDVSFLPPLGAGALALWILTSGLGEETGWRGFALPRLQRRRSALGASAVLTAVWAGWHLPMFFYLFAPAMAAVWLVGLFAAAVLLTWLFNGSRGSVLLAAVFHGTFNFVTSSTTAPQAVPAAATAAVIVGALLVIWRFGRTDLAPAPRVRT